MSDIEIRPSRFGSPVARALVAEAMVELGARYGGSGDDTPVESVEFDPPNGLFVIAWRDGEAIGCAGWRSHGDEDLVAELKRMYVAPPVRGTGVAARLLAAVEDAARGAGRVQIILECGDKQPEAIALYEKCGYTRIPNFGYYRNEPGVCSYGRDLI